MGDECKELADYALCRLAMRVMRSRKPQSTRARMKSI